ncbi:LPS export ABC transporter permease LptF [Oryzomicrobium sp.]|uniref:LPS export ABC transporter permease LptF n=1 Tax=Oryzomicrobium sp. TaxID=1911578 RepID=UPI0025F90A7B|nr:LPS export ABC transporter permease LptF [Oryzomicrobium sp.]MCE1241730.1 LPS export ABC transporter permease LptF [Oryzomicrobium sp.]
MVFARAARREFGQNAAAIFVALFAILITTQLIRLLGQAAGGKIAPSAVAALMGFGALSYLHVLLSLTVFIAILMAVSRSYRDSEMVVWFSSGHSLAGWIRPVALFIFPLVVLVAITALFLTPWSLTQSADYRQKVSDRQEAEQVSPGAFHEIRSGSTVVFVESLGENEANIGQVFVASLQHGRQGVMVARQGHQEYAPNGDRFVVLENGRRYDVEPGAADARVLDFQRYAVRIETRESRGVEQTPSRAFITDLVRQRGKDNDAELFWRLSQPLSMLVLAFLAVPLGYVNPRAGRSANMLLALLTFAIYLNLNSIVQAWVGQGKIGLFPALLALHGGMALFIPVLFYRRIAVKPLLRFRS